MHVIYSIWVTDGKLMDYYVILVMSSLTDVSVSSSKGGVCVGNGARSGVLDGLLLLLSSKALPLKCFSRFIKLPCCLRQSPEWLISFAPRCRQNLWSKDPESAPGGSHRVMCSLSPVSHCLGQSTIITGLWSPWFSGTLAMHYSLKRLCITRAMHRMAQ